MFQTRVVLSHCIWFLHFGETKMNIDLLFETSSDTVNTKWSFFSIVLELFFFCLNFSLLYLSKF